MSAATLFAIGVGILTIGWLWFYIVRPMLEDFGWIVNDTADSAPVTMSSKEKDAPVLALSSKTDAGQTPDRPAPGKPKAEQYLTICRVMREAGINRDVAQAAFKACDLPFNNNVWRDAAPPVGDDDVLVTPYAGRRTRASYYPDDPDLEFQAP
jgi:hypothetical protein